MRPEGEPSETPGEVEPARAEALVGSFATAEVELQAVGLERRFT